MSQILIKLEIKEEISFLRIGKEIILCNYGDFMFCGKKYDETLKKCIRNIQKFENKIIDKSLIENFKIHWNSFFKLALYNEGVVENGLASWQEIETFLSKHMGLIIYIIFLSADED